MDVSRLSESLPLVGGAPDDAQAPSDRLLQAGILEVDARCGRVLDVSASATALLGRSSADLCATSLMDLTYPPDRQRMAEALHDLESGQRAWDAFTTRLLASGSVPVEVHLTAAATGPGGQRRVIAFVLADPPSPAPGDAATTAGRPLRGGAWDWELKLDPHTGQYGDEIYFSPQFKALLGFKDDEFPNSLRAWRERILPDDRDAMRAETARYLSGPHTVAQARCRVRRRDGLVRSFCNRSRIIRDEGGTPLRWVGVYWDATGPDRQDDLLGGGPRWLPAQQDLRRHSERLEVQVAQGTRELAAENEQLRAKLAELEQARDELTRQHGILQAIVEGTTDAVFVKDLSGRYVTINSAGARFLGRSVQDVIGKDDRAVFSPATAAAIMQGDRRVIASGRTQTYEDRGTAMGVTRTYLSTKGIVRDEQGRPAGLFGISRDITGRKWDELRLRLEHVTFQSLYVAPDWKQATGELLQTLCESLGFGAGALWLPDDEFDVLCCACSWFPGELADREFARQTQRLVLPPGIGLPGLVWQQQRAIWMDQQQPDDPRFPRAAAARDAGLHGCCALPLAAEGEVLGVLEFFGGANSDPELPLVETLSHVANQFGQFLHRRRLERAMRQHDDELRVARRIQQHLLPDRVPELPGWSIYAAAFPAELTGGDSFDYLPTRQGLGLLVADASGHGYPAALMIATARAYARAYAQSSPDVGFVLECANRVLARDMPDSEFVAMCLAHLEPESGRLTCAAAGHPPPAVFDARGELRARLDCGGLPLGVTTQTHYAAQQIDLAPGELLVIVTDGLLEARASERDFLGFERLCGIVRHYHALDVRQIVDNLYHAARAFCRGQPQEDDITVMAVRREA
jgi:sigma-B regulation protein RsbU (phosphoserine phosphatase)